MSKPNVIPRPVSWVRGVRAIAKEIGIRVDDVRTLVDMGMPCTRINGVLCVERGRLEYWVSCQGVIDTRGK